MQGVCALFIINTNLNTFTLFHFLFCYNLCLYRFIYVSIFFYYVSLLFNVLNMSLLHKKSFWLFYQRFGVNLTLIYLSAIV